MAKLVEYDPLVLKGYADRLYREARTITVLTAARYAGIVFLFTLLHVWYLHAANLPLLHDDQAYATGIGVSVVLIIAAAMVGAGRGADRAFHMKLEAQQVLCQVAIEANTSAQPTKSPAAVHTA